MTTSTLPTSAGEALKTLESLRLRHTLASQHVLDNADFLFAQNVNLQKRLGDECRLLCCTFGRVPTNLIASGCLRLGFPRTSR